MLFPVVKTEAASGGCPIQGLLNCLKEIPVAQDMHPSPSGVGDPRLPEDPGAWKRTSGGKGHWLGCEGPRHCPFLPLLQAGLWVTLHSATRRPHICVLLRVARCWGLSP